MDFKICGIATMEAANAAIQAGATMIGFVFAPSKRTISITAAKDIVATLPSSIEKVGVFVNESSERVQTIAQEVGLTMVQLHGEETFAYMRLISYPIIKAVSIDQLDTIHQHSMHPAMYIIDSPPATYQGGNGVPFDWKRLEDTPTLPAFLLAGGLTPENVYEAIIQTNCSGVDVSSGVETNTMKDHHKINLFIQEAKRAKGDIQ